MHTHTTIEKQTATRLYLHIYFTEVAVTVLDDVCMFGVVKHRHGSLITPSSDIIICRVDGDGHQVHEEVTDKCNACTLSSELKTEV